METKICKKCNVEKSVNDFRIKYEKRFNKSYLYPYCKDCERQYYKEYSLKNKEKIQEYHKKNNKKYNSDKQYHKEYQKRYRKRYYEQHKKEMNQNSVKYKNKKRKQDALYKLKEQIRTLVWLAFNNKGFSKSEKTENILGCTFKELHDYLLQTFKNNYGYDYNFNEDVHIDHIIPLKYAKTKEEIIKLNHYTNLQLLKAKDNIKKGDKLNWKLVI